MSACTDGAIKIHLYRKVYPYDTQKNNTYALLGKIVGGLGYAICQQAFAYVEESFYLHVERKDFKGASMFLQQKDCLPHDFFRACI